MKKADYTEKEVQLLRRLNTPQKIQDYIDTLEINFSDDEPICLSPRLVMRTGKAHCMEGALLAAAALEYHGRKPLVMDLRASKHDADHVVAVFKQFNCFGAISKTNHGVLRYREPIYRTLRELALSFFHEYFDDTGNKTLREYSSLLNLHHFDYLHWCTSEEDLYEIPAYLDDMRHFKIVSGKQIQNLRKADEIEIEMGKIVEWKE